MPVFNLSVRTSTTLHPLSKALTDLVNSHQLSAARNVIVYAFTPTDVPEWQSLPPIWHRPSGTEIVINLGKFEAAMAATSATPGKFLGERMRKYNDRSTDSRLDLLTLPDGSTTAALTPHAIRKTAAMVDDVFSTVRANMADYDTYLRNGDINPQALSETHRFRGYGWDYRYHRPEVMAFNLLIGTVIREAAYAIFTQRQVRESSWYAKATGYEKNVITVLEELRVEAQAIKRIDGSGDDVARKYIRTATPITANVDQVLEDMTATVMSGDESGASVANIALNSSLILGRATYDVLLGFEVAALKDGVDNFVGTARLEEMHKIWAEYVAIRNATEANIMPLIKRWIELFPSEEDGSNASSSVAPAPGSEGDEGEESDENGEGEGEEGEGEGEGEGQGEGENEGEGDKEGEGGKDGGSNGEGEGEKGSSGKQQRRNKLKENKGGTDAKSGTKGAQPTSMGAKNASGINSDEDPGKDEIVASKGLLRQLAEEAKKDVAEAVSQADYANHEYGPKDRTPSRTSYNKATHRMPKPGKSEEDINRGRAIAPSAMDFAIAGELAKVLENLNVADRGKFTQSDVLPPGRMRSRAAVQQAAERAMNLPATAKPWERTKRTVDLNPPVTVGIMTDVSGSMGWAEKLTAEFAWIVQHAVSTINGRTAALAFGNGATVTLRPGEHMSNAQVVSATGSGEEFDMGAGTLDVMLNLLEGQGTRMLFVFTDGQFVFENMMAKRDSWLKELDRKGVHVVWVTPNPDDREEDGYTYTPRGVIVVSAQDLYRKSSGYGGGSEDDVKKETRKLITSLGAEIQKAIRNTRMNRRG